MDKYLWFTILWITCIVLAIALSIIFFFYVKLLTTEQVHKTEGKDTKLGCRHYWRFFAPWVCLTVLGFISMDVRMTKWGHLMWIIIVAVLVPWGFTWLANRQILAKRWDRIFLILTIILGFNLLTLTGGWAFERRWQTKNYQGQASISNAYPLVNSDEVYTNQLKLDLTWSCSQYSWGSCTDTVIIDCGNENPDFDQTIYPQGNNYFDGCENGFTQLSGDDDGFVAPYMKVSGDCYYCEIDEHSNGRLYKGVWRMIIALFSFTVFSAIMYSHFKSSRKSISEHNVSPSQLIGSPRGDLA